MAPNQPEFPSFTALSEQIFFRQPDSKEYIDLGTANPHHPRAVLIFSWGDAQPKNLLKYADGYKDLFPHSTQVVVLAPISKAMFSNLEQRTNTMKPIINTIFPPSTEATKSEDNSILIHMMSNTGGINYAATLNAYVQIHKRPLPHQLLVLDSAPGSVVMTRQNLYRWSGAMALGTAKWFPWPFIVTQAVWASFLCGNRFIEWLIGKEPAPVFSLAAVVDERYETSEARQLYLYSREDNLINYEDIEAYMAEAKRRGYEIDSHIFEGSGHVRHMHMHSAEYWGLINQSWNYAVKSSLVRL